MGGDDGWDEFVPRPDAAAALTRAPPAAGPAGPGDSGGRRRLALIGGGIAAAIVAVIVVVVVAGGSSSKNSSGADVHPVPASVTTPAVTTPTVTTPAVTTTTTAPAATTPTITTPDVTSPPPPPTAPGATATPAVDAFFSRADALCAKDFPKINAEFQRGDNSAGELALINLNGDLSDLTGSSQDEDTMDNVTLSLDDAEQGHDDLTTKGMHDFEHQSAKLGMSDCAAG
jgi:hypothetical protein